jgi:hypothetical protein
MQIKYLLWSYRKKRYQILIYVVQFAVHEHGNNKLQGISVFKFSNVLKAHTILVGNSQRKIPLGRPMGTMDNKIKRNL